MLTKRYEIGGINGYLITDEPEARNIIKRYGGYNIRKAYALGYSNQPEVLTFTCGEREAKTIRDALSEWYSKKHDIGSLTGIQVYPKQERPKEGKRHYVRSR